MNIVTVIPIRRGIRKETLSYFTSLDIPAGSVIKVPLRSKMIPGIVIEVQAAPDMKNELRNAPFAIRKIGRTKFRPIFLPEFIEAAAEAAAYFAGSTGGILALVSPKIILEQADKIKLPIAKPAAALPAPAADQKKEGPDPKTEPMILQADEDDRLAHYKSLIRSEFALKRSVFFCVPTIQDAKRAFETLPKGIEDYAYVLNSSLSAANIVSIWNAVITEPHPVLIIATGSFLGIPRHDIGTIIVERESSTGYKSRSRPYLDIRTFAEIVAKKTGARLVFGDILLRTETLWKTNNGQYAEASPLKFRSLSRANVSIIDMKKYKTADAPEFRIISDEVEALGHRAKENNEPLFIFTGRRGLAPLTVCGDCGTSVLCSRCSAPIVLHRLKKAGNSGEPAENIFLCHRCGERRDAAERCKVCGSWKLTTLGIGIELLEETLRNMFPATTFFRIDKDATSTHRQAAKTAADFYDSPGSILLGTEMALPYLERPLENSAIAAIDSLFSIPDFRINEKIMNIILRMRSLTQKQFVIQTRSRSQRVFDYAASGNLMDFYREEIDARKALDYPPFSTLIKITVRGTPASVAADVRHVESELGAYSPTTFPAFVETTDGKTVVHALIRVKPNEWPIDSLLQQLISLPPQFSVNVDPENLL